MATDTIRTAGSGLGLLTVASIAAAIIAIAGTAAGQDAQGNGTANDRNQQQGSGGVNRPASTSLGDELRFRNAIVTGNAPNGLSFRGELGYASEREFRGELGSDDLFSFRRDTLYSGLSGLGIRGTDALQYQFALTTGNRPSREFAGSLSISRDSFTADIPAASSTQAALNRSGAVATAPSLARVAPEELEELSGAGMWRLRSPAAYTAERSLSESLVGSITTGQGQTYGITASPLTGVRVQEPSVSPEAAMLRETLSAPLGVTPDSAAARAPSSFATPGVGFEGYLGRLGSAYDRAVGSRTVDDATATTADRVREQNSKLSDFLRQLRQDPVTEPENEDERSPERLLNDAERLDERFRDLGIDRETIDALRDEDLTIDALVAPSNIAQRSFFSMHMNEGRRLMSEGAYFGAEARFALALSLREDDATAAIARVHAQLGAGLFLSAAINLRETLNTNPVLIGAKYAEDLIPSHERLVVLGDRLTALSRGGGAEGRNAALLLAYVGHQLDDNAMIERALDRIDLEGEDPLSLLLRVVWIPQDTKPAEPTEPAEPTGGEGG